MTKEHKILLKNTKDEINNKFANKIGITLTKLKVDKSLGYSMSVYRKSISISNKWYSILAHGNEQEKKYFYFTIGHELAHIKNHDGLNGRFSSKMKMLQVLREVRADIEGRKIVGATDDEYKQCLIFKNNNALVKDKSDCFKSGYPTWELRIKLFEKSKNFNEQVIEKLFNECKSYNSTFPA